MAGVSGLHFAARTSATVSERIAPVILARGPSGPRLAVTALRVAWVLVITLILGTAGIAAQDSEADGFGTSGSVLFGGNAGLGDQSASGGLSLIHRAANFAFQTEFEMRSTGVFTSSHSNFYGEYTFLVDSAGLELGIGDFQFSGGRLRHRDAVDSRYSLFVNSRGLPATLLDLSYDGGRFFAASRWLQLNLNSALDSELAPVPNRGAVIKTIGVRVGRQERFTLAFQDATVFTQPRSSIPPLEIGYWLTPIPSFFLQYEDRTTGKPWGRSGNDNSIVGFLGIAELGSLDLIGQVLVDDANANAVLNPEGAQNPNKVAAMLELRSILGGWEFRLGAAMATKYTFQSIGTGNTESATDARYGYSYLPLHSWTGGGELQELWVEDNMVGFLHGENSLALGLELASPALASSLGELRAGGLLELVLRGAQSPGNPWHEFSRYAQGGQGTRWLGAGPVETMVQIAPTVRLDRPGMFAVLDAEVGYRFNASSLVPVPGNLFVEPNNSIPYFSPGTDGRWRFRAGLRIGLRLAEGNPASIRPGLDLSRSGQFSALNSGRLLHWGRTGEVE